MIEVVWKSARITWFKSPAGGWFALTGDEPPNHPLQLVRELVRLLRRCFGATSSIVSVMV